MEYRPLEITVISADDLKNVNLISTMDVYVVVSIPTTTTTAAKIKANRKRTPVDKSGGRSPNWNHHLKFSVDESALSPHYPNNITFKIKSQRLLGDREIGEVVVPIKQLLHNTTPSAVAGGDGPSERIVDYQVRSTSGKPKGSFKFSYKFGEKTTVQTEAKNPDKPDLPVTAYPPPPGIGYATAPPAGIGYATAAPPPMAAPYGNPGAYPSPQPGYGYPQPPAGYGGGYPPAPTYGYPQPPAGYGAYGYGAPVDQQMKKKKKKMGGMGMGMGLGAGLLGGLLVGEMISDVGEMGAYDAGYDAGFGDAGF
ncbi:hypothetical protein Vadar_033270 [Vaccinium darrowii]|uniref:Uncharacterized protein n=1 Tax=Vaccinium darrowii TaxID=229202 RepID=A0ACB7Y4D7_9ERIC|nr:hypothetical protein Vadar_033270 [Vaccinium darrowii]